MKSFIILAVSFFLMPSDVMANSLTFDPTVTGQTTLTITCDYPIEREDGTALAINEIAKVNFFVEKNGVGGYLPAGENTIACRQVYDLSQVLDGVYVYVATVTDTDGRESLYSTNVTAMVKRLSNPNAPGGVSGSRS